MMTSCELTILMPCLNEAETLSSCIQKAKQFLQQENITGEVLIADNGSTDGSQVIAKQNGARVVQVSTRGYGAALRAGLEDARGKYIIIGDADNSYDFLNLSPFMEKLRLGNDLVIGNRFKGGIIKKAMPFLNRYIGNPILSFLGRLFFKTKIGDFHCGLRGFHREKIRTLNLQGDGMEFASEMIIKASLNQLKVTEVPTHLYPDGRNRRPHLRPWRDGWRHLRLLLLLSPSWLFLYPGLLMMTLGILLMCYILVSPFHLALHLNMTLSLLSSLFVIVGFQAVCFSMFSFYISDDHQQVSVKLPNKFFQYVTLERGLILSLMVIIIGSVGLLYSSTLETITLFLTSLICGIEFIFISFFMSFLKLNFNKNIHHR